MPVKCAQNLLGRRAVWRGRGLKVGLPLQLWVGRPYKVRLGKRHNRQSCDECWTRGIQRLQKIAIFSQSLYKTPQRLERFQKDSKRLAETSPMLADANRTCNALMSAADSSGQSDIPTMSAALSCQCDGPINCCKLNPASSKLFEQQWKANASANCRGACGAQAFRQVKQQPPSKKVHARADQ